MVCKKRARRLGRPIQQALGAQSPQRGRSPLYKHRLFAGKKRGDENRGQDELNFSCSVLQDKLSYQKLAGAHSHRVHNSDRGPCCGPHLFYRVCHYRVSHFCPHATI